MQVQDHVLHSSLESSIDKSPYVNIMEDGMIAPVTNDGTGNDGSPSNQTVDEVELSDKAGVIQQNGVYAEKHNEHTSGVENESSAISANQQGEEVYTNKLQEIHKQNDSIPREVSLVACLHCFCNIMATSRLPSFYHI
jgi:uncharacterized protein